MKKQTIILRGESFDFTEAAESELRKYLKELGRATVVQKTAYLECTEALRDILHDRPNATKTVSKKELQHATEIVGIPPVTSAGVLASMRLFFHDARDRITRHEEGFVGLRRVVKAVVAFVLLFVGLFMGAAAILLVIIEHFAQKGSLQEISFGVVRMTSPAPFQTFGFTLLIAGVLFVAGICTVTSSYWLLREKYGLKPWIGIAVATVLFGAVFTNVTSTNDAISYTQSARVYLQQCNSEIPMYLPDSAPFTIYRQLTSEGYQLAAKIPTDHNTMLMDTTILCKQYAKLSKNPAAQPILQLYKEASDGSAHPFDQYNDVGGSWSFGLFAKS